MTLRSGDEKRVAKFVIQSNWASNPYLFALGF
jgi:hypothetical protein